MVEPGGTGGEEQVRPPVAVPTVLVVDDAPEIRARVEVMVICEGCDVIAAAGDGETAVRLCAEHRPDLVILDIRMPRRSGLDALTRMKALEPAPKVVVLTNYDYGSYRARCASLGAEHYLVKWRDFERLREIISDLAAA